MIRTLITKEESNLQVIDLVLDASPPHSTSQQQIEYQTEVLTTVMENLLGTELFGSESNISNVCYLAARLVDKLWQGQLSRDPHEVSIILCTNLNDCSVLPVKLMEMGRECLEPFWGFETCLLEAKKHCSSFIYYIFIFKFSLAFVIYENHRKFCVTYPDPKTVCTPVLCL